MAIEYKTIRIEAALLERIMEKKGGMSVSKYIESLIDATPLTPPTPPTTEELLDALDMKSAEDKHIDEFQSLNLEVDELLPCCQKIYKDDIPRRANCCEHWELAYHNQFGNSVISYKNKLSGRFCDDPLYLENYAS